MWKNAKGWSRVKEKEICDKHTTKVTNEKGFSTHSISSTLCIAAVMNPITFFSSGFLALQLHAYTLHGALSLNVNGYK